LCERLCEVKRRWCALVEHADLPEDDKWKIFCLLIGKPGHDVECTAVLSVCLRWF